MSPGSRCAACKYLRRKCPPDCILAPYFPSNNPQRFACVHRIYGASNVIKMLQKIKSHDLRAEAANSLHFEAQRRIEDPVYGCAGMISQLHQRLQEAETELAKVQAEIAFKSSTTISVQEIDRDHHDRDHHDVQLLEIESDLHNVILQGQTSVQPSHFGPSTKAPWQ